MAVKNRQRQNSLIEKYLSMILEHDLAEEGYGIAAITELEVSPDGSRAWVTISTAGSTEEKLEIVEVLNENTGLIRSELAEVLQIRHTPYLTFKADLSRESEEAIDRILAEANPLPEEKAEPILKKEQKKMVIPERKASEKTNLKKSIR